MTDLLVTVGRMKKGLAITLLIPGLIGCAGTPPASTVPTFGGAPGNPSAGPTTQASAGPDVDVSVVAAQIEAQPHETRHRGRRQCRPADPCRRPAVGCQRRGHHHQARSSRAPWMTVEGMPIVAAWDMQPAGLHFRTSTLLRLRDRLGRQTPCRCLSRPRTMAAVVEGSRAAWWVRHSTRRRSASSRTFRKC